MYPRTNSMDLFILNPRDILTWKHPWNKVNPVTVVWKIKGKKVTLKVRKSKPLLLKCHIKKTLNFVFTCSRTNIIMQSCKYLKKENIFQPAML